MNESFVVYCSDGARAQAERRGLGGLLEARVETAVLEGRVVDGGEDEYFVTLGPRLVARAVRKGRTPGGRRRLIVTRLQTSPNDERRSP